VIDMKNINKSYQRPGEGSLEVLSSLDFEVADGEFVAIIGPSGSGKSTLMNILGLLDRPDEGRYKLDGSDVVRQTPAQQAGMRNRTIGFVFQQFHLLPNTTAAENVELPMLYNDAGNSRERAVEALCRVGLQDRLNHYPNELSGGQQQRVAIARALVNQPRIILADEPTGNLDREAGQQVMQLFKTLNGAGSTIVFITHDPQLAEQARRVMLLDDGRLTETTH
jgi:ABC-type lipoprotein export system ATPase subunit